jgi:hypothetical protein
MRLSRRRLPATGSLPAFLFLLFGSAAAHAGTSETDYLFVFSNPVASHENEYITSGTTNNMPLMLSLYPALLVRKGS